MASRPTTPDPCAPPAPPPPAGWRPVLRAVPALAAWALLVGLLAHLLLLNANAGPAADEANLAEWLEESRVFRKTLRDLAGEYLALRPGDRPAAGDDGPGLSNDPVRLKAEEIREQLKAMAEPTRMYQAQLPLFPVIFRLELAFDPPLPGPPLVWESQLPRPTRQQVPVRAVRHPVLDHPSGRRAWLGGEYLLHSAGRAQREAATARRAVAQVTVLLAAAGAFAAAWGGLVVRWERQRELERVRAAAAVEHAELQAARARLAAHEAERQTEELDRRLLEQSLKASAAEREALQVRSQLYASIGVMAGSYAHNIKNLLVRPNDLLARCLERDGLPGEQAAMLGEVRQTLGTVTERLQQILRTVQRDPSRTEMARLDLGELVRDTHRTWAETAREKWRLDVTAEPPDAPLWVEADRSHLQQALENLLFNARDATFEMRSRLREEARRVADPGKRKQALIDAAGWAGAVTLRAYSDGGAAVLEVRDNGIGMTPEVRERALEAHFSTKRDNALFEGFAAGMGLGLSFVAVVLDHHRATLEVESEPLRGALFRARFPAAG